MKLLQITALAVCLNTPFIQAMAIDFQALNTAASSFNAVSEGLQCIREANDDELRMQSYDTQFKALLSKPITNEVELQEVLAFETERDVAQLSARINFTAGAIALGAYAWYITYVYLLHILD